MIKIQIQNKELGYRVLLADGENIKILINNNEAFNETVSSGKQAKITFKFQESIFEE